MSAIPPDWTSDLNPQNPEARRLEYVRHHLGYGDSLKSFWRALCEDWDDDEAVSYPAVRYYHWKRPAPVKYYRRISEVFGVRLDWLIKGEGDLWDEQAEQSRAELDELLAEAIDGYRRWPSQARAQFVEALAWYTVSAAEGRAPPSPDVALEDVLELGKDLYWLIMLPLRWRHPNDFAWGFIDPDTNARQVREYLTAMIHALSLAFLGRGEGFPLEYAEQSVIRRLRYEWGARQQAEVKWFSELLDELSGEEWEPLDPNKIFERIDWSDM